MQHLPRPNQLPPETSLPGLKPTTGNLLFSSRLLQTTLTLLNAMAKLAQTGSNRTCWPLLTTGYNTPAATGRPMRLYISAHKKLIFTLLKTTRLRSMSVSSVEICYTYLNRIVPMCVHILADSSINTFYLGNFAFILHALAWTDQCSGNRDCISRQ